MLLFAGLAALFQREAPRVFWGGSFLAGGLYLLLLMYSVQHSSSSNFTTTNSPVVTYSPLTHEQLITTRLILWCYSLLPAAKTNQFLPPATTAIGGSTTSQGGMGMMIGGGGAGGASGMSGMPYGGGGMAGMGMAMVPNPSYIDITAFTEVGHALWTLLFAWLGGLVAAKLYRTQQPKT
jgi:hypothetical protein